MISTAISCSVCVDGGGGGWRLAVAAGGGGAAAGECKPIIFDLPVSK